MTEKSKWNELPEGPPAPEPRGRSRVNRWTEAWFKFRGWRERRRALLREEQERALAREEARVRAAFAAAKERPGTKIEVVRWGQQADEPAVAELLELNGMPRWVAFEERFVVAEGEGKVLGALRYRTESKRLLLGLLVVDPWAGEGRMARALYAGAGELAGKLGVGKVVASGVRAGYAGEAGYRRRGRRQWRLEVERSGEVREEPVVGRWRRVFRALGPGAGLTSLGSIRPSRRSSYSSILPSKLIDR